MTREQLLASLTGVKSGGWYGDDGRYVDWSTRTEAGEFQVEVGDRQGLRWLTSIDRAGTALRPSQATRPRNQNRIWSRKERYQ